MTKRRLTKAELYVTGKFIISQLTDIACDGSGRPVYLDSVDQVFDDVFGYKKLASKINNAPDDFGMLGILMDFGIMDLFTVCNTVKIFGVIEDLVRMDASLNELNKRFKRYNKKNKKKPKDEVKEFKYIYNLYKETVKALRKQLGYNTKASYKNMFESAKHLVDGYSREGGSYFEDAYYDYGDVDDEDDEDELSPFEEFVKSSGRIKITNRYRDNIEVKPRGTSRGLDGQSSKEARSFIMHKRNNMSKSPLTDREEGYVDYDEDDEDDIPNMEIESLKDKINTLSDHLQFLTSALAAGKYKTPPIDMAPDSSYPKEEPKSGEVNSTVVRMLSRIERKVEEHAQKQEQLEKVVYEMGTLITDVIRDEDDDDELDQIVTDPDLRMMSRTEILAQMNKTTANAPLTGRPVLKDEEDDEEDPEIAKELAQEPEIDENGNMHVGYSGKTVIQQIEEVEVRTDSPADLYNKSNSDSDDSSGK